MLKEIYNCSREVDEFFHDSAKVRFGQELSVCGCVDVRAGADESCVSYFELYQ